MVQSKHINFYCYITRLLMWSGRFCTPSSAEWCWLVFNICACAYILVRLYVKGLKCSSLVELVPWGFSTFLIQTVRGECKIMGYTFCNESTKLSKSSIRWVCFKIFLPLLCSLHGAAAHLLFISERNHCEVLCSNHAQPTGKSAGQ